MDVVPNRKEGKDGGIRRSCILSALPGASRPVAGCPCHMRFSVPFIDPESAPERSDEGGHYALRKESAPERSDEGGHYALRKESARERSDGGGHDALRKECVPIA